MTHLDLADEISAFMKERVRLAADPARPWVVFAGPALQGAFADLEEAMNFALARFPDGKFLIRDVHAEEPTAPLLFAAA